MARSVEQSTSAVTLGKDSIWMEDPESKHFLCLDVSMIWFMLHKIEVQFSDFLLKLAKVKEEGLYH